MIAFNDHGGRSKFTEINQLTETFSAAHEALATVVAQINEETQAVKDKHLPQLREAVKAAATAKGQLHTAISGSPDLFEKPRTHTIAGIKVGLQKGKGIVEFEDAEKTVSLIKKHYGENAIAYLVVKEAPDKKMLADMPVSELKKIGCTLLDTGDQVVIRPMDSEIEKVVAALLKDAVDHAVAR